MFDWKFQLNVLFFTDFCNHCGPCGCSQRTSRRASDATDSSTGTSSDRVRSATTGPAIDSVQRALGRVLRVQCVHQPLQSRLLPASSIPASRLQQLQPSGLPSRHAKSVHLPRSVPSATTAVPRTDSSTPPTSAIPGPGSSTPPTSAIPRTGSATPRTHSALCPATAAHRSTTAATATGPTPLACTVGILQQLPASTPSPTR